MSPAQHTNTDSQTRAHPLKKPLDHEGLPRFPKYKYLPIGLKTRFTKRIAVDSDDEDESETKVTPAVITTTPVQAQQQKQPCSRSTAGIENSSQVSAQSQQNRVRTLLLKEHTQAKKTNVKSRQPARSSLVSNSREIIESDWPFAHLGALQAHLNGQTRKRKPQKSRKHGRPSQQVDVAYSAFLDGLPAEVRNRIYEFVIPQTRILICANRPKKEQAKSQKAWENQDKHVNMPRSRLYCMMDRRQIEAGFEVSAGLLLTCKQIKTEVELFMYSRTIFCFQSPKTIDMFMANASKEGIRAIQSIELRHEGYGEPSLTEHIMLKQRHDLKWEKTYKRIKKEMVLLDSLRLEMRLHDWPVKLHQSERWFKALMLLVENKPLGSVRAFLKHDHFSEPRMSAVARKLENRMMSEKGRLARDKQETILVLKDIQEKKAAEKAYRATLPPVQAKKVLKIRIEECKVAPRKPVQTSKTYTQSLACWEWKYGQGNTLGGDCMYGEGGQWKE